jgi:hypothetical protein
MEVSLDFAEIENKLNISKDKHIKPLQLLNGLSRKRLFFFITRIILRVLVSQAG